MRESECGPTRKSAPSLSKRAAVKGDSVYAASLSTTGTVRFRADKIGSDTALAQIIKPVEDAQGSIV
jgi:cation transport ATPase